MTTLREKESEDSFGLISYFSQLCYHNFLVFVNFFHYIVLLEKIFYNSSGIFEVFFPVQGLIR